MYAFSRSSMHPSTPKHQVCMQQSSDMFLAQGNIGTRPRDVASQRQRARCLILPPARDVYVCKVIPFTTRLTRHSSCTPQHLEDTQTLLESISYLISSMGHWVAPILLQMVKGIFPLMFPNQQRLVLSEVRPKSGISQIGCLR